MCRLRFVALTDYAIQCRPRWGLFPKADKGITDAARRRPYLSLLITQRLSLIAQKQLPIPVFADGGYVWDV